MAPRPIMDPTKQGFAAVTMVYKDYVFLDRWFRHYSAQFGAKHLYVISHGNDPEHRRICPGASVLGVHRDPELKHFDRRRWAFLSRFASGLLRYYNWIIVGDVDEIVVVDPDVAPDLPSYISRYDAPNTPRSLCPLGLEIVHNPRIEPDPIAPDVPILTVRRNFRLNANYSKPCLIRSETHFTGGGHANLHLPRVLDPHLYLIHLRYFDEAYCRSRLEGRQELRSAIDRDQPRQPHAAWGGGTSTYDKLSVLEPVAETIDFPAFREKMVKGQQLLHDNQVAFFGGGKSKELYRLPERFARLF